MAASPGDAKTLIPNQRMNQAPSPRAFFRWLLGALLLWAAVSKLANPVEFLGSLYAYQLPLPKLLLQLIAITLPWLELALGFLLLLDRWTESCLISTLLLFAIFILATGQAWLRGLNISCGCFNLAIFGLDHSSPIVAFVESVAFAFFRNLVLAGFTSFVLLRELSLAPITSPTPQTSTTKLAKSK